MRDPNADSQLAADERSRRQLMSRFMEAAFTQQFGEADAAASQFAAAVALYNGSDAPGGSTHAQALLRESDGFEAETALLDSVTSFQIMSEVQAGRTDDALLHALAQICAAPPADLTLLDGPRGLANAGAFDGAAQLQSPFLAAAVAVAAEAYAAAIPLERADRAAARTQTLELARQASRQAASLTAAGRFAERYPHLRALAEAVDRRVTSPDEFLSSSRALAAAGQISAALAATDDGLRRHPGESTLWQELVTLKLGLIARGATNDAELRGLLTLLATAGGAGHLADGERAYAEGIVYEQLGDAATALARFEAAVAAAADAPARIRAMSKAAALRARQPAIASR
jgi:hypothetical protein